MKNKAVEDISNNVKKYRVWKGIRQADLAKDLKISICHYRNIESGYYPKYQIRSRICKYFDVNHDQMFYIDSLVGGVLNETC